MRVKIYRYCQSEWKINYCHIYCVYLVLILWSFFLMQFHQISVFQRSNVFYCGKHPEELLTAHILLQLVTQSAVKCNFHNYCLCNFITAMNVTPQVRLTECTTGVYALILGRFILDITSMHKNAAIYHLHYSEEVKVQSNDCMRS